MTAVHERYRHKSPGRLQAIADHRFEGWQDVHFRYICRGDWQDVQLVYSKEGFLYQYQPNESDALAFDLLIELINDENREKNTERSGSDADDELPLFGILSLNNGNISQRFMYKNPDRFTLDLAEFGQPHSFFNANTSLPPAPGSAGAMAADQYLAEQKADFARDKRLLSEWQLTGFYQLENELEYSDEDQDMSSDIQHFLSAEGQVTDVVFQPVAGLLLSLYSDDSVYEQKQMLTQAQQQDGCSAEFAWYDIEGVLENRAVPFTGFLLEQQGKHFIFSDAEQDLSQALINSGCRYDDGDTQISDQLVFEDDCLIRIVSVVTDELYLSRLIYRYQQKPIADG